MGDISFDLTKNKGFSVIPYACTVVGAAITIGVAGLTAPLPLLAAGALAGGLLIPAAVMAAIATVISIGTTIKSLYKIVTAHAKYERASYAKDLKNNLGFAVFLPVVVGLSSAKALLVTPFQSGWKGLRSAFNTKAKPGQPTPAPKAKGPDPQP